MDENLRKELIICAKCRLYISSLEAEDYLPNCQSPVALVCVVVARGALSQASARSRDTCRSLGESRPDRKLVSDYLDISVGDNR